MSSAILITRGSDEPPAAPEPAPPPAGKVWLAWCTVAAGLIALAIGLFLSISEAVAEERPTIAIVIDDVGLDPETTARVIALPGTVTLALLPYAEDAPAIDAAARAAGHETILHLPMEPRGLSDPGPHALTTWLDGEEIAARVTASLAATPGVSGISNHMGSRFTECLACVAPIARAAAERDLFILDSVTTEGSVLAEAAESAGVATARRDVFLDNERGVEAALAELDRAERIARRHGAALAIGHPYPETLTALERWLPEAQARGVRLSSASALARKSSGPDAVLAQIRR